MTAAAEIEFNEIIMALRHAYNNPSLESQIQHLAVTATVSNRFLIKMEIMNLSREVERVIDLRTLFKEGCEKFIYNGISHFLDHISKNEFKNEINRYGGNYTLGVYKHIMQKAKTRLKLNPHALVIPPPKTEEIYLTQFFQRKDERLYFVKKVSVFYNSPEKMSKTVFENFAIEGLTTDISSTGLSIKIAKQDVRRTDGLIHVWMHGIEGEFKFSERVIISYEIKKTFEKNGHIYFNLDYHSKQCSTVAKEFIAFSENYLEAQKKRNNIPVENTINAIKVKASEQFIIETLKSLPVFLLQQNNVWLPGAQFKTKHNTNIGLIANVNDNKDFLRSLCMLPSIQSKIASGARFFDYLFIMQIKDKNNKTYYVALPYKKVIDNAAIKKVAITRHQKQKLKLYRIDGSQTSPETQCHVPSSLPSYVGEAFESMNQQPAEELKSFSNELQRMVVISDFSDSIDSLKLLTGDCVEQENRVNLSQYILKKPLKEVELCDALAETNDFRMEDRFICTMDLQIQKKEDKSSEFIPCSTIDISTRGLKITLSKIMNLNVRDKVLVRLGELSGDGVNSACEQAYKVVGQDSPLVWRLVICGNAAAHQGRKMVREYIYKNLNNMQPVGYENEIYGLSRVLRNIFTNNIHLPHGIIAREGTAKYIKNIAISENSIIPVVNDKSRNELLALMETEPFRMAITDKMELINKENPCQIVYLIVMSRTRSNGDNYFFIKPLTESQKGEELIQFMQHLKCIGDPRLLRINISKKGLVFNKYFRDEMTYLEAFAAPKVKSIESALLHTIGVFEMADVTELIV
ncbi:hypothetical protein [Psychromonas sp.]|uniref:hypothetical protein n=1 Tax=Psychromonas sp. TaxID=1884585 RepID=UPI0039E67FE2